VCILRLLQFGSFLIFYITFQLLIIVLVVKLYGLAFFIFVEYILCLELYFHNKKRQNSDRMYTYFVLVSFYGQVVSHIYSDKNNVVSLISPLTTEPKMLIF
jgi:hypothetical protein